MKHLVDWSVAQVERKDRKLEEDLSPAGFSLLGKGREVGLCTTQECEN